MNWKRSPQQRQLQTNWKLTMFLLLKPLQKMKKCKAQFFLETYKDENKKLETEINTDDKKETGNEKVAETVAHVMGLENVAPIELSEEINEETKNSIEVETNNYDKSGKEEADVQPTIVEWKSLMY